MPFADHRLTLELVPHCASVARDGWVGSHDDRPLSDQGRAQAERLVGELGADVDAIYSSPALRCRETVAPLAKAAGQNVVTLDALAEVARGGWYSLRFADGSLTIGAATSLS
jgi:broad specificity phosphatase PhoE